MKIIVTPDYNFSTPPDSWYFLPDSAIINPGKPFFIPEAFPRISASLVMALKINRLGKTIAPRFANRYFNDVAFGVHFHSPKAERELLQRGLSPDRARAFDRAVILSEFIPKENFSQESIIDIKKNNETVLSFSPDLSDSAIGPALQGVSAENTLKMGDLILPLHSGEMEVTIGDHLEVTHNSDTLLRIEIK